MYSAIFKKPFAVGFSFFVVHITPLISDGGLYRDQLRQELMQAGAHTREHVPRRGTHSRARSGAPGVFSLSKSRQAPSTRPRRGLRARACRLFSAGTVRLARVVVPFLSSSSSHLSDLVCCVFGLLGREAALLFAVYPHTRLLQIVVWLKFAPGFIAMPGALPPRHFTILSPPLIT